MNVYLTANARRQLQAIHDFIAQDSSRYARRVVDRILRRMEQLADMPRMGSVVEEYASAEIREIVEYPYRVFYRVKPDQVDIIAVIHGARQLPANIDG